MLPKKWGGWGIKDLYIFSRALVANVVWRLIMTKNISMKIIVRNYVYPLSIIDWVQLQNKYKTNVSTIWKFVLTSFNIIDFGLARRIGSGEHALIEVDP